MLSLSKIKIRLPDGRKLFEVPHFDLPLGTHLLVHGPSGQGKTTWLHLLSGLLLPNDGEVKFNGRDLTLLSDTERSQIRRENYGLIFQKLNLLEHLDALENVMLGALKGSVELRTSALTALAQVGLEKKSAQLSVSLSLGEQQRVAVARVLARTPQVILADEPTSSLDQDNAKIVIEALLKAAHGRTLVVVSHDERLRPYFTQHIHFNELVKL